MYRGKKTIIAPKADNAHVVLFATQTRLARANLTCSTTSTTATKGHSRSGHDSDSAIHRLNVSHHVQRAALNAAIHQRRLRQLRRREPARIVGLRYHRPLEQCPQPRPSPSDARQLGIQLRYRYASSLNRRDDKLTSCPQRMRQCRRYTTEPSTRSTWTTRGTSLSTRSRGFWRHRRSQHRRSTAYVPLPSGGANVTEPCADRQPRQFPPAGIQTRVLRRSGTRRSRAVGQRRVVTPIDAEAHH